MEPNTEFGSNGLELTDFLHSPLDVSQQNKLGKHIVKLNVVLLILIMNLSLSVSVSVDDTVTVSVKLYCRSVEQRLCIVTKTGNHAAIILSQYEAEFIDEEFL